MGIRIGKMSDSVRTCRLCGRRTVTGGYHADSRIARRMAEEHLCYDCAYWTDLAEFRPGCIEVLEGKCMKVLPAVENPTKDMVLGGRGKMRYFMRPDRTVFASNDIWTLGAVPPHVRHLYPDTVLELTRALYNKIRREARPCRARGCLDRYGCLRFNMELERKYGPYNAVPAQWVPGGEHCGIFLDKRQATGDTGILLPFETNI